MADPRNDLLSGARKETVLPIPCGQIWDAAQEAALKWGVAKQEKMVIEEAAEAIVALCHMDRGRLAREELLGEAADLVIVGIEAAFLSGCAPEALWAAVCVKLDRLNRRIRGEEGHFGPHRGVNANRGDR
jgi:hypothetical protein